jgi:hypothetical protein
MSIRWVDTPRTLTHFDAAPATAPSGEPFDNELGLDAGHVHHVAELFNTPLTGAYNWDYRVQDDRITKLYELGKTAELERIDRHRLDANAGLFRPPPGYGRTTRAGRSRPRNQFVQGVCAVRGAEH